MAGGHERRHIVESGSAVLAYRACMRAVGWALCYGLMDDHVQKVMRRFEADMFRMQFDPAWIEIARHRR